MSVQQFSSSSNSNIHRGSEQSQSRIIRLVDFSLVYRAMASEEDEVRALLMRHRKQIIREVNDSELVTVLTQKGVLSTVNQKHLNDIQTEKFNNFALNNVTTPLIKNLTLDAVANGCTNGGSETIKCNFDNETIDADDKKCIYLIDVIARNGFEKFKEFCYAIESECPKLIADLIHDRLHGGKCLTYPQNIYWFVYQMYSLQCEVIEM